MRIGILVLAAALISSSASAQAVLRYTWGPASDVVVNQQFQGPAIYSQTLSVTGLSGSIRHFLIIISIGPHYPAGSAWDGILPPVDEGQWSYPPRPDCEGGPGFEVSSQVAGATPIPNSSLYAYQGSDRGVTNFRTYTSLTLDMTIDPPLVADPSVRYGVATLQYHHENSAVGTSPDACDGAELPMCWMAGYANVYLSSPAVQLPLWQESPLLSWQNPNGAYDCYYAVTPTRPTSWGAIKTLYR